MQTVSLGATGLVGQGVLRELLLDARVSQVLAIGRGPTGQALPQPRFLCISGACTDNALLDMLIKVVLALIDIKSVASGIPNN